MDCPLAQRRSRYVREPRPAVLTPASLRLLEYVAVFRLVSLPQLVRLGEQSPKATQRAMRTLFDAGLVDIVAVPRAALAEPGDANDASLLFGSAPNVYVPACAGIKFLNKHHLSDDLDPPPSYGPKNALFLRHELGIRDVRVFFALAARRHPDQAVKCWQDGPEAIIDLERVQVPKTVRPDAWFVYRLGERDGREAVLACFLELDRATERGERRWQEKLVAYGALFAGGRLRGATGYVNARVLVTCPTEGRRKQLAELIGRAAGLELARRFWLSADSFQDPPSLTAPVWQRPGSLSLQPLVPPALMDRP